jgi:hypothetical protein
VSYIIAKDGQLPASLDRKIWKRPVEGLLITAGVTLVVVNLFDLSSIAMMRSAGFIIVFAAVNAAGARLSGRTGGRRWVPLFGTADCLAAIALLVAQTILERPLKVLIPVSMLVDSFSIEVVYRRISGRTIKRGLPPQEDD